ncbi:MAG: ice-binding family protein [Rhodospirillaceae bacterium]
MSSLKRRLCTLLTTAALPAMLACAPTAARASAILGAADAFAVFAGASVTNTGSSVITGEVGVSPGSSVTGFFPPGIVNGGTIHLNDGVAVTAGSDFLSAYVTLAGSPVTQNLTGGDLGVGPLANLSPGVYKFDSTAQLNGALTLDGGGDPNAQFIFLIGTALTTASASSVVLTNGAFFENVYWLTGTAATLGSTTAFAGSILAGSSIIFDSGAGLTCGRALAQASVTLINNTIGIDCKQDMGGGTGVPEPDSRALLGGGLLVLLAVARYRALFSRIG